MIRALVVEDDTLLRSALASALESHELTVVSACASAAAANDAAADIELDVVITDLDLGAGPNGITLAHALRRRHPLLGVVLLTSYSDPRIVGEKLSQVPEGTQYIVKQSVSDFGVLRTAIERSITRARNDHPLEHSEINVPVNLTDGQMDTLRLLSQGLSNAEIAERRVMTVKSVEVAISRLAKHLGVSAGHSHNQRVLLTRAYYRLSGLPNHADDLVP
ncbi:MAG: response regulator transcription factor [Thermoleophilia bacterium]